MATTSENHRTPNPTEEVIAYRSQTGSSFVPINVTSLSIRGTHDAEVGTTADADARSGVPAKAETSAIKTGLFANLNQEARSSLNAIIGLTEVLLSETAATSVCAKTRQREEFIARINSAGLHLIDLLDSAADIVLIEDNRLPPEKALICVNDLILELVNRLTPIAQQFDISFQTSLDPELPYCMLDAVRVRQALRCVIDNAIKFLQPDGVVDIWTTLSDQRGIVVVVADRGVGICREDLENIFLPFQRRVPSTARRYNGAGVGLALAKKYVEFHEGKIWLTSEPDVGTTVEIMLPHGAAPERSE
ncbi:MAG: HAMP domain-containing sensor histidine kinase [Magnetospirillum sp.]|nr:HAMP domain-containing sensor histidine kinase [Magnetospirillum sp.]